MSRAKRAPRLRHPLERSPAVGTLVSAVGAILGLRAELGEAEISHACRLEAPWAF